MPLESGTRLGQYEIVSPLGAGGMGEVYKAKDSRLARFVAVKVLPASLARSDDALARFEREARSVAALNHPGILGIHDFATHGETSYVVMELLEGESLRARLDQGPLSPRRAVELAIQMAEGLAAAHEKGVIHRDLKPENLWITKDGRLKILDFGLAKQMGVMGNGSDSYAPTVAPSNAPKTEQGMILGTLGYMSPEQVRGEAVDARADIFAFGVVLFEMLSGKRAFARPTAGETMAAILRDDSPELEGSGRPIPAALQRIVQHCLEKSPERRFHSALDVAFALQNVSLSETTSAAAPLTAPFARENRRATRVWAALSVLAFAGAGVAGWTLRGRGAAPPTFRPLTHERGTLSGAHFVPNSPEVIYSAQWGGGASQWYSIRTDQPGTRTLQGSEGILLSVSQNGEGLGLARPYLSHGAQVGSLFSLPLAGGAQRESVSSSVWGASQGAKAGEVAAVIGDYGGENRLEWPLGHVVWKGLDTLRAPRIHGDRLAFFQEQGDILEDGALNLVDRAGKVRPLTKVPGFTGMAWGPGGREIWVSSYRDGESRIFAVDLSGKSRTLLHHAGRVEIQDVDASGRVLAALHSHQRQTFGRAAGESKDRDLGWLDAQATLSMSADGRHALIAALGEWSRLDGTLYLRPLSGAPAQSLGIGQCQSTLSRDGKWVATCNVEPTFSVVLVPTGPGAPRRVPLSGFTFTDLRVDLMPDGKSVLLWGRRQNEAVGFHVLDLATGNVKKISAPGASPFAFQQVFSPDGKWIAYVQVKGPTTEGENLVDISRVDGTEAHQAMVIGKGEALAGWGPDSASLLVWDRNKVPADVDRIDIASGRRTRVATVQPPDAVGIGGIPSLQMTPDGTAYTYNVVRRLSELYLVEGLK
jgi:eukaryotic-like serine/threonine-protein kinase